MRIAALSDFHIGARDRGCAFQHDSQSFEPFLDALEQTHDEIILLGDVWQLDHEFLPTQKSAALALQAARSRTKWLDERIKNGGYTVVHGNHDAAARDLLGLPTSITREGPVLRAVFTHGDAYDPLLQGVTRLSHTATWVTGRLRWAGLGRLAQSLEAADVRTKAARFSGLDGPYAHGARRLAAEADAQFVVMGHTHTPLLQAVGQAIFANTGTCSLGQRTAVSIDLCQGHAALLVGDQSVKMLDLDSLGPTQGDPA